MSRRLGRRLGRQLGLRPRLALSHAMLALSLVLVAWVLLDQESARLRRTEAAEGVERDAEVAARRAARILDHPEGLGRVVADERAARRAIELVDVQGKVLGGSVPPGVRPAAHRAASDALEGVTTSGVARRRRYAVGAAPILQGDEVVGAAVLVEPASRVQPWPVPTHLALLESIGLVAAAAVGGWLIAGHVSRPIEDLTTRARMLALGASDADLSGRGSGSPEVETLRAAVSRMMERTRSVAARSRERESRQAVAVRRLTHQLRTPVSVLALRLDELSAPDTPAARRAHLAGVARRQIDTLAALSSNLEDVARGAVCGGTELVDVAALILRVTNRLQPLARSARTRLLVTPAVATPALADPSALEDAVANVVENAIKYTPPGGTVRVEVRLGDGETAVEVADSGPGIPLRERDLVVRPWVRGEAGAAAPGSGLGLSLAVDALSRAEGRLEIDDSPSGGTLVRLVLPLATSGPG